MENQAVARLFTCVVLRFRCVEEDNGIAAFHLSCAVEDNDVVVSHNGIDVEGNGIVVFR